MVSFRFAACAAALLGAATGAHAAVLYDNLNPAMILPEGATALSPVSPMGGDDTLGASFATPGHASLFTSLTLWMRGNPAGPGSFVIAVAPDLGIPGIPFPDTGAPLVSQSFTDTILEATPTAVTFAPATPVVLDPDALYWVLLQYPAGTGTSAEWFLAPDDSGFGVAGENEYLYGGAVPNGGGNGAFMMSVDPEAVSEPAALAVLGLGLTGLAALRRRS